MNQRDQILNSLASAKTQAEQFQFVAALDAYDRNQVAAHRAGRETDWAETTVAATLRPMAVRESERASLETDWLSEMSTTASLDSVIAEAAAWYGRVSAFVKSDKEEFAEQARGMARRTASMHGEQAEAAERSFLEYVSFLQRRTGASGLDQVQQLVDGHENPKQTALPDDVFDTFGPPVHPINQGVVGTEQSTRAPLINEIESNSGQASTESHHDETQSFAGPAPVEARPGVQGTTASRITEPLFTPTVGISHVANLDDFRPGGRLHAEAASSYDPPSHPDQWAKDNPGKDEYDEDEEERRLSDADHRDYLDSLSSKQAASGLPQVQQTVDAITEDPEETPLPEEVAFPWGLENVSTPPDERSDHKAVRAQAIAFLRGLAIQPTATLSEFQRIQVAAFHKHADEWSQGGSQYHGPGAANSPATTPEGTSGTYSAGYAEGQGDWRGDEAPTFADASSAVPPFVQGHSTGYGDAAQAQPGGEPGQVPPGAGGMGEYQTHAASKTAAMLPEIGATTPSDQKCSGSLKSMHKTVATNNGGMLSGSCPDCGGHVKMHANDDNLNPGHRGRVFVSEHRPAKSASRQATAANMTCANCGTQDKSYNMTVRSTGSGQKAFCTNCRPISADHGKSDSFTQAPARHALRVSAAFVTPVEEADTEFLRGYKYASQWGPRTRLVRRKANLVSFEAGLYAGMADNTPENQALWVARHHAAATRYEDPNFTDRIRLHESMTQKVAAALPAMQVQGSYLKQAATSTDLDTAAPSSSPSPTGQTPINGPGTPPPLAGQADPAVAGGPSPYNGAEPFGAPVVPNGASAHGTPTAIDSRPGAPVDAAAQEHISQQTRAFKQRVAANLAKHADKVPVCRGCGEAFDSKEVAHEAHGKFGCGSTDTQDRGYQMTNRDEAF